MSQLNTITPTAAKKFKRAFRRATSAEVSLISGAAMRDYHTNTCEHNRTIKLLVQCSRGFLALVPMSSQCNVCVWANLKRRPLIQRLSLSNQHSTFGRTHDAFGPPKMITDGPPYLESENTENAPLIPLNPTGWNKPLSVSLLSWRLVPRGYTWLYYVMSLPSSFSLQ